MAQVEEKKRGLGFDLVLLGIGAVVAIWLAFAVLGWIAGLVWLVVKVGLLVGLIGGLFWYAFHRRS